MNIAKRISKHNEILLFREHELFATLAGYSQNLPVLFCCTSSVSLSCCVTLRTYIEVLFVFNLVKTRFKSLVFVNICNQKLSKTPAPASALKIIQARDSSTFLSLFFLKQKVRRRLHCTSRIASLISGSFIVQGRKNYREHDKQCKSHTRVTSESYIMTNVKDSTEMFS